MKPSDLKAFLAHVMKTSLANPDAPLPAIAIHGAPGLGKSQIAAQAAKESGMPLTVRNLADEDPGVFGGLTFPVGDATVRLKPEWFPTAPTVLFFDEYLQAPPLLQNITAPLINPSDRILAQKWPLPPGSVVLLAMNRRQDRAATHEMPEHIKNRCIHIELVEDLKDFRTYAEANGVDLSISHFLEIRPNLLHNHDPKKIGNTARDMGYPTPRSWFFLDNLLKGGLFNLPLAIQTEAITGVIGEGACAEFLSFTTTYRTLYNKYHPTNIIAAPSTHPVPDESEASITNILMTLLARLAAPSNFDAIVTYLLRISPEFAASCVSAATARDTSLKESAGYVRWATAHPSSTKTNSDFEVKAPAPSPRKR